MLFFNFLISSLRAEDDDKDPPITRIVYFDIEIDGKPIGRIEMGLFGKDLPKTTENFRHLCVCDRTFRGTSLCYKRSRFFRIIPGFVAQGGDYINFDGSSSLSIYGKDFEDESFIGKHRERGYISMANAGPNGNGSQFFFTFCPLRYLDDHHVVFGKIINGFDVLSLIEKAGTPEGKPTQSVIIADSGEL